MPSSPALLLQEAAIPAKQKIPHASAWEGPPCREPKVDPGTAFYKQVLVTLTYRPLSEKYNIIKPSPLLLRQVWKHCVEQAQVWQSHLDSKLPVRGKLWA